MAFRRALTIGGLSLVRCGFRPVPLFNGCTGQHEVIDQKPIIEALRAGAAYLATSTLANAPPAFLLDSRRSGPPTVNTGDFDNRWKIFPQDFPSASHLSSRGFARSLLVQRNSAKPADDLAHVLRRWQEADIPIELIELSSSRTPTPITVETPNDYRSPWQRVLAIFGLRQNSRGGLGDVVPEPSHG